MNETLVRNAKNGARWIGGALLGFGLAMSTGAAPQQGTALHTEHVSSASKHAVEYEAPDKGARKGCGALLSVVVKANGTAVFRYEACDRKVKPTNAET